jgi:hypothetical protein
MDWFLNTGRVSRLGSTVPVPGGQRADVQAGGLAARLPDGAPVQAHGQAEQAAPPNIIVFIFSR